jgi:hypothetical protein
MAESYRKEFTQNTSIVNYLIQMVKFEMQVRLEFALSCKYISEQFTMKLFQSLEIGKLINYMILNPEIWK